MAQQPQAQDQTDGAGNPAAGYAGISNPQFVGGSIDPSTNSLLLPSKQDYAQGQSPTSTPAPTAPTAPAPQAPTTQLGQLSAPAPAATPSLGSTFGAIGKGLANDAAPYLGATIGGSIGSQVGAGISGTDAALNTVGNLGNVLKSGYSPAANEAAGVASYGGDFASAAGSGVGAGLVTAGIGALTGEQPKTYLPAAVESGAGAYLGSLAGGAIGSIFGPAGTLAGSALGSAAGSYLGPIVAKDVTPAISSAEKAIGNTASSVGQAISSVPSEVGNFLSHIF